MEQLQASWVVDERLLLAKARDKKQEKEIDRLKRTVAQLEADRTMWTMEG